MDFHKSLGWTLGGIIIALAATIILGVWLVGVIFNIKQLYLLGFGGLIMFCTSVIVATIRSRNTQLRQAFDMGRAKPCRHDRGDETEPNAIRSV